MGATEPVSQKLLPLSFDSIIYDGFLVLSEFLLCTLQVVSQNEEESKMEDNREEMMRDLEKGETFTTKSMNNLQRNNQEPPVAAERVQIRPPDDFHMSRMQGLSSTNPLRLVMNNGVRPASPSLSHPPNPPIPRPFRPSPISHPNLNPFRPAPSSNLPQEEHQQEQEQEQTTTRSIPTPQVISS